jgi:hypothetical protein
MMVETIIIKKLENCSMNRAPAHMRVNDLLAKGYRFILG